MSAIRFLADESCDFVVHALRADGYDVLAVSEVAHRPTTVNYVTDAEVMGVKLRIILTDTSGLNARAGVS